MGSRRPFRQMQAGQSLDFFHQQFVVPTSDETMKRNADIDSFVRFLHSEFSEHPYTVNKIVKSGSLGKGTAVRGSADIDLVVFLNGLSSIQDLKASRGRLLDKLEQKVRSYGDWRGRIQLEERRTLSLQYSLDGQELDILPAYDILSNEGKISAYRKMASSPEGVQQAAWQFSASLAALQIGFVKPVGEEVKRVIRLVKYWKKERDLKLRSYTVELITIYASRGRHTVSTDALFRAVMELLRECSSLKIAFNDNYNSADYTRSMRAPYVLDPANPYMNTLSGVDARGVSEAARDTLRCL